MQIWKGSATEPFLEPYYFLENLSLNTKVGHIFKRRDELMHGFSQNKMTANPKQKHCSSLKIQRWP